MQVNILKIVVVGNQIAVVLAYPLLWEVAPGYVLMNEKQDKFILNMVGMVVA